MHFTKNLILVSPFDRPPSCSMLIVAGFVWLFLFSINAINVFCLNQTQTDRDPHVAELTGSPVNVSSHCGKCSDSNTLNSLIFREPKTDCISGHFFAVVRNIRCDCDFVCARHSSQPCRLMPLTNASFNDQILCDTSLKLNCNEATNLCQGPLLIETSHIRHESFYVHWKSRLTENTTLSLNHNANATQLFIAKFNSKFLKATNFIPIKTYITKSGHHELSTKIQHLTANTTYVFKIVDNGFEEFAIVKTDEISLNEALPKILFTNRNSSSISIAFDDFKPSNYKSGYAINYRQFLNRSASNEESWTTIQSNNTPFYILNQLKPNTSYQIQVFTWENLIDKKIGLSSEIVNISTLDGCIFQTNTFEIGDNVVSNCDQVCICQTNNSLYCTERCSKPYIPVKVSKWNNFECSPHPSDECCVHCIKSVNDSAKFIDKPGTCSEVISNSSCVNECTHDYHCTGINKCCKSVCGSVCLPPANSTLSFVECPFKCGPNAVCKFNEDEAVYKCVCQSGFISDEPLQGCFPKSTRSHRCVFEENSFNIGQQFEHKCRSCFCSEALEIECRPKCPQFNESSIPAHCKLLDDPVDPACCKIQICEILSEQSYKNESSLEIGCKHLNQTFSINETFFMDCELKCLCKANGELECMPRCFSDPGYDESYCYLVPDPDDAECCKISICDHNRTITKPNFIIEMAESINSTSIKLKVLLDNSTDDNIIKKGILYYSKILPNETETEPSDRNWTTLTILPKMILSLSNKSSELSLSDLESETDYLIYLKLGNSSSNIVFVRTYPTGIDNSFKGCFHGNQIIQVGEIFYEGECEYKCICREGGIRECEERCPVFVDLIGYENCHWVPSPEDLCCTIPICKQDPSLDNLHCTAEGKQYKVGETWTVGSGCSQKACNCVMISNTTAEIQCKNGCPIIPQSVLKPNSECASPQVVEPKDLCICPYVICNNNINPLDLPEKSVTSTGKSNHCEFKANNISIGEEFYDNCRATCRCEPGAILNCTPIHCNPNFGPHVTNCLEWDIDPHFIPRPPNCCPEPKCKNDGSCSFAGIRFPNYKHIPQELLPCGKKCICTNGQIHCENTCPDVSDTPPLGLPCPPSFAFRGHLPGDKCCIQWQCRDVYQDKIKGNCIYKEQRFKLGETWDETDTGIKKRCQCKVTNEILHVSCNPGSCQAITERFLQPTPECSTPTVIVPKDPIMCPYVICNSTRDKNIELESVDIIAINATSARIRFSIPELYVGLLGHAEVHYSTDFNIPRNQWNIQKFARPKRMFDIPNIEYHLGNLKPDTTYFMQIEVFVEALKSGPASEIYKIYLPPLPVPLMSTSTTTTSTLPPIIMLDMHLTAKSVDSTSVQVSWRPFTIQEKRFIDGIQIRYKKSQSDDEEWSYSPILHRNINSFNIENLVPGVSYTIDLLFTSVDDINTNIVSSRPTMIDVPLSPKDDFKFDVHIFPDDVSINEGEIHVEVQNLPRPINKYINVAKFYYQNMDNSELMFHYVTIDESAKVSFSNLQSNTRYKVWIDFYLTNGQVTSSNSVDIITNYKQHDYAEHNPGKMLSFHLLESKYVLSFMVISVFVFVTGAGFMLITCIFMRKHSTAAITRACISEAAYDNPTYKTFESGEKCLDESLSKNGIPSTK